ncbi:MAG: sugar kinase, partial [Chloroflexi bacterium]|nr:sugar kinase [Chloroflexota bacterium]
MMLLAGTVPLKDLPLTMGTVGLEDGFLLVDGHPIPCTQGTGAMVGAALATTEHLKLDPPQALGAGDTGQGGG